LTGGSISGGGDDVASIAASSGENASSLSVSATDSLRARGGGSGCDAYETEATAAATAATWGAGGTVVKTAGTVASVRVAAVVAAAAAAAAGAAAARLDKATAAQGWYGKSTKPEKSLLLLLPWLLRDSSGERPDADDKPYTAAAAA